MNTIRPNCFPSESVVRSPSRPHRSSAPPALTLGLSWSLLVTLHRRRRGSDAGDGGGGRGSDRGCVPRLRALVPPAPAGALAGAAALGPLRSNTPHVQRVLLRRRSSWRQARAVWL
eukprot:5345743-Pyramimonas_sp.AAC.1